MIHLIEPRHDDRFREWMDRLMPTWRSRRAELNRAPWLTKTGTLIPGDQVVNFSHFETIAQ
jgi:predicted metal-dependent hydrolase